MKVLWKCFAAMLATVAAGFLPCAAFAQSVLAPQGATAPRPDALVVAATNMGAKQCLPVLASLSSIGIQNSTNNDTLFDVDRRRPDKSPVFSLLGIEYQNSNALMSLSAVPEADGSCSVAAERISVVTGACGQVAMKELRSDHATRLLSRMTVYTNDKDPGSTVSLVDIPGACLVTQRYVKFSSPQGAPAAVPVVAAPAAAVAR